MKEKKEQWKEPVEALPDEPDVSSQPVSESEPETPDLNAQLEDKSKQCDELLDRLQRTMAEFDNYRKRTTKEKASMYDAGVIDTVEKLLPVIDNFERALSHGTGSQETNASDNREAVGFYKGIEMIFRQFKGFLDELGVEIIPGVGQSFDHNLHFAVSHVEDDKYGENEIIEELQKGYKYKDKVIRASMVKVAN